MQSYVSGQQAVDGKGTPLSFIIGAQNDEGIFYGDDKSKGPNDYRQCPQEIIVGRLRGESRGKDIKGTCSNVYCLQLVRGFRKCIYLRASINDSC